MSMLGTSGLAAINRGQAAQGATGGAGATTSNTIIIPVAIDPTTGDATVPLSSAMQAQILQTVQQAMTQGKIRVPQRAVNARAA
jgi:hypothetical protein